MATTHTCEVSGATFETKDKGKCEVEHAAYQEGFIEGIKKGFHAGYHRALLHQLHNDFATGWQQGYDDAIADFKCGYLPDRKLKK